MTNGGTQKTEPHSFLHLQFAVQMLNNFGTLWKGFKSEVRAQSIKLNLLYHFLKTNVNSSEAFQCNLSRAKVQAKTYPFPSLCVL